MAKWHSSRAIKAAVIALTVALVAALSALPAQAGPKRPGPVGSDDFVANQLYGGDFPDPSVLLVGHTFYAYGTTIGFLNLPTLSSPDLVNWVARPSNDPARWWLNDSMPIAGSWAQITQRGLRTVSSTWAPHVIREGPSFLAAYSARTAAGDRRCVGIAAASSPTGPFIDYNPGPVVCPGEGAIDPFLFKHKRRTYLMWKSDSQGIIYSQPLTFQNGQHVPGSPLRALISPKLPWEGGIVENPGMVFYKGKFRLFYSGNDYASANYATGLANCKGPLGPCKRVGKLPLMSQGYGIVGTGGASPFFTPGGKLYLAYHAWRAGKTGYPSDKTCRTTAEGCAQRRLYIAQLAPAKKGRIRVAKFYLNGP